MRGVWVSHEIEDPPWPKQELLGLAQLPLALPQDAIVALSSHATVCDASAYAPHYSSYGKDDTWTAIALRGFYDEPERIEKPSEMDRRWRREHEQDLDREPRDTPLRAALGPALEEVLATLPCAGFERICLMRLAPDGGEVTRHVDVMDASAGRVVRIHIPLVTNERCVFQSSTWATHNGFTCWWTVTQTQPPSSSCAARDLRNDRLPRALQHVTSMHARLVSDRSRATPTEEAAMRKIVAGLFMSLDGVVEYPEHWGFQYFDEEMTKRILDGIAQADAVLIGRRTYLEFAQMWPTQGSEVPMSDFLNNSHKHVVSSSLDKLDWGPASLVKGDLGDALTTLKQEPGKNIQIPGSPSLVRSLLAQGMLDELSLNICPVVVGSGLRLFEDVSGQLPLNLVQSAALSTGVINATYQPTSAQQGAPEPSVETFPGQ